MNVKGLLEWLDAQIADSDAKAGSRSRYWTIENQNQLEYRVSHNGKYEAFQNTRKKIIELMAEGGEKL